MRTSGCLLIGILFGFVLAPFLSARASNSGSPVSLGPDRGWIGVLALSPSFLSDGMAWAAPEGGRIYASQTHGASWAPSHAGETDPDVTGIAPSPGFASDRTVFAAADDGIFKSMDAGATWSNVSSGPLYGHYCRVIWPSPQFDQDSTVYAACDTGVFRSTDGGASWLAPTNGMASYISLSGTNDPHHNPQLLFAGPSGGGLALSSDGGATWSTLTAFPSSRMALSIAVSPSFASDGTLLVGTDDGVYVSQTSGASWSRAGLDGKRVPTVAFSPAYPLDHTAFAGSASGDGVLMSTTTSFSWSSTQLTNAYVEAVAVSPQFAVDHTVVAGLAGSGIEVSRDGGASWVAANDGLHAASVVQMRVAAGRLGIAGNGGASYLDPASGTWVDYRLPTVFATAYDAFGNDVYVGTQTWGLQLSHDLGQSWTGTDIPGADVSSVGLSPEYGADGTALVADGYVYVSTDFGRSWKQASGIVGNDVQRFRFSPAFDVDRVVFAGTAGHGVLRSGDGGLTWTQSSAGLPPAQINDLLLSPGFVTDRTVYAATTGYGVYRSVDGGASWSPLPWQPARSVVTALLWDPDGALLAGTEKGVYRLDGTSWSSLTPGWDDLVTELDRQGYTLYAGTAGDGVWSVALAQPTATPTSTPPSVPQPPPAASTPTATSTARPTVKPAAKPTPTRRPPARTLHPYAGVVPNPMTPGSPALVWVQGPLNGGVRVTLRGSGWHRDFNGKLAPDGSAAFGFVAPRTRVAMTVIVWSGKLRATVKASIEVVGHP